METIHFLAGLPRTGSTLLGSLLSQNPYIHVTPTSPVYPLLVDINESFNRLSLQYTFDSQKLSDKLYKSLISAAYEDIDRKIIFDKHRGWPKNIPAIKQYINSSPTIVATIRPIVEIIISYITLADKDPNNFLDAHLNKLGEKITNESRALLLWEFYLKVPYESLKEGLDNFPENILLIEYDDIVYTPHTVLNKIYLTCDLPYFRHSINKITNYCGEADEKWGMQNLHTIRPTLSKLSKDPELYLPLNAIQYFNQFNIKDQSCHANS